MASFTREFSTALNIETGLPRLTASRFTAQLSDGIHQAALGGIVLLNPTSASSPLLIATSFAVMLLPYSLIGPFISAALDRWDRRLMISYASWGRTLLIGLSAALIGAGMLWQPGGFPILFALSLMAIGFIRLITVGISAALPHVVSERYVAAVNSGFVTIASVVTAVGATSALAVLGMWGATDQLVALLLLAATVLAAASSISMRGFAPHSLGPAPRDAATQDTFFSSVSTGVLNDMVAGLKAANGTRSVAAALTGISMGRVAFGCAFMGIVLLMRQAEQGPLTGASGLTTLVVCTAAGMGVASLSTPWLVARARCWLLILAGCQLLAAVWQLATAMRPDLIVVMVTAVGIGWASQTVKLYGDHAMHTEIDDGYRASVFAVQDALFNAMFVAGAFIAVGWDFRGEGPVMMLGCAAVCYVLGAVGILARSRHSTPTHHTAIHT